MHLCVGGDVISHRCLSRSGSGKFADCFQTSCELVVLSDPGDPVEIYADIEGESDNPSPIGGTGSGAAVAELNIALSLTREVGPRLPEIISADNPNSSADTPDSKRSSKTTRKMRGALTCEERHVMTLA